MGDRSSVSSLSHPSYASDEQESAYLARARALHWIRFSIALIILGAATAVVGCEGAPLHHYKDTVSFEKLWLPLWPLNLDVRQTNALLACGVVIMFQALIYIVVALIPSVCHHHSTCGESSTDQKPASSANATAQLHCLYDCSRRLGHCHCGHRLLRLPPVGYLPDWIYQWRNNPFLDLQVAVTARDQRHHCGRPGSDCPGGLLPRLRRDSCRVYPAGPAHRSRSPHGCCCRSWVVA